MDYTGRLDAIYARQSVDKADSISIDSQIDFCKYELRGNAFREYRDKGFSGKNTDRPQFQHLIQDIEAGLIARVVVYKLDRISRSILDFSNLMELFQKHGVEFVSSTEKFDTSTPMGRAMLNICIVFAQLERETIQKRVADAYHSRTRKGIRMGGRTPYGYTEEPFVIQGITTKRLTADPEAAENIKLMYAMYSQPQTSFGDVARFFSENDILVNGKSLFKTTLSELLRNPVYVQADMDIYDFFKNNGAEIEGDAADFTGLTGCRLFRNKNIASKSKFHLHDKILVPSPHEGIVPSDLWLKCRKKMISNQTYQPARKPRQTWLAGKTKCGRCGYALMSRNNGDMVSYMRCRKRVESKGGCPGCGTIRTHDLEQLIYQSILEKLREFKSLSGHSVIPSNPKLTAAKVELAQVESDIEKLVDSLIGANATLVKLANRKAEELESRRQSLVMIIADLSAAEMPSAKLTKIYGHLDDWENTSIDDKRRVVDSLIAVIRATSVSIEIEWKI